MQHNLILFKFFSEKKKKLISVKSAGQKYLILSVVAEVNRNEIYSLVMQVFSTTIVIFYGFVYIWIRRENWSVMRLN